MPSTVWKMAGHSSSLAGAAPWTRVSGLCLQGLPSSLHSRQSESAVCVCVCVCVCVHPTPRWSLTHHMSPQSDTVPDAHRHPGDIHWMESMYPARALLALQGWRHGPKKGTLEQGSFLGGK